MKIAGLHPSTVKFAHEVLGIRKAPPAPPAPKKRKRKKRRARKSRRRS